jgi:hypothetical protein
MTMMRAMRNSGACPKCHGEDIIRVKGTGNIVPVGLRPMLISRYVRFRCGFSEEWLESRADLERLRAKFGYVRDEPAPPAPGVSIERQLGLS